MTPAKYLAEVRARLKAATPGPWSLLPSRTLTNVKGPSGEQICQLSIDDPNARLIASAPTDLAKLSDALEKATKTLEQFVKTRTRDPLIIEYREDCRQALTEIAEILKGTGR